MMTTDDFQISLSASLVALTVAAGACSCIMADYIEQMRNALGTDVVTKLCSEANSGRISVKKGKKFARHLGETVCGNFIRDRRDEVGKMSRDEMEQMLSDFWSEEGISVKGKDELLKIISDALKIAQIPLVIKPSEESFAPTTATTSTTSSVPWLTQFWDRVLCCTGQARIAPAEGVNQGLSTDEGETILFVEGGDTRAPFLRSTSAQCARRRRCKKRWWLPPTISIVVIIALMTWLITLYSQEKVKDPPHVTRSIRIGGVREPLKTVKEIHKCDVNQTIVPDLPVALHEHVGLLVNNDLILVCGGTSSETIPHNPKTCLTHTLGSDSWEPLPYEMSTNRRSAHAKISDNKVFVIGGSTSDPWRDGCLTDQEVWSLEDRSRGWSFETVTHSQGLGHVCSPSAVIIDIPCK